jgi:cytochrome c heme-lyase
MVEQDACPYKNSGSEGFIKACPTIDPSTNLPSETDLQLHSSDNAASLPTERSASSIPRSSSSQTWSYPSPRMFYNALLRKGYDTRPEDVQVMVHVHNFLNEQVWAEVLKWESQHKSICGEPTLKRFMGKPRDLSPRARFFTTFFGSPRPFDRHDWTVDRCGNEVRYVIDYYSGPKGEESIFYCDVRPALDSWEAFVDRSKVFFKEKVEGFKSFIRN